MTLFSFLNSFNFFYCWLVLCLMSQYNISRNGYEKNGCARILYIKYGVVYEH